MRNEEIFKNLTLSCSLFEEEFRKLEYPWEILPKISEFIIKAGDSLSTLEYERRDSDIWVHKNAKIAKSAYLKGPLIVCEGAEIRHCAFIRGNALIGKNSVVGNSTEIKNSILFDGVQAPHYNYIGDSVLGAKVHLGAGVILSNLRLDKENIIAKYNEEKINTRLRKMGAIIGDNCEIGCGSVVNPGRIIEKNSIVFPLSSV